MYKNTQALRGTSSDALFLSQSAAGLSSKFGKHGFSNLETPNALREGETCWNPFSHSIEPQQQERLPPLASAVSSLSILYKRWKEGTLSKTILKDFLLGEDPEQFLRRRSQCDFTDDYGLNCTVESWQPVSYSSGHDVGTRTSRKRCIRRSTPSRLKRARSGTPRTTQGLVPGEPRGFSDDNGGRAVQLACGGDEPMSSGCGPCSCLVSSKSVTDV